MSAFEVGKTHIDALVTAALRAGGRYGSVRWLHGDVPGTAPGEMLPGGEDYEEASRKAWREVSDENAETWGATLLAENRRSVNHRYDEDEIEQPYVFTPVAGRLATFDWVAVLKALDCYEYQSCEHPGWEASEARDFCEALRRYAIRRLPGYGDAAWEVTSKYDVLHPGELPLEERRRRQAAA